MGEGEAFEWKLEGSFCHLKRRSIVEYEIKACSAVGRGRLRPKANLFIVGERGVKNKFAQ